MNKIPVKTIKITRAEGPCELCRIPHVFVSWDAARAHLGRANSTYPADGCYDKHDFIVTFEDGETYTGRLDVKQLSCRDNDQDVKKHVNDFMNFYAGLRQPFWMSDHQYDAALEGVNRQEYLDFLNKYDV